MSTDIDPVPQLTEDQKKDLELKDVITPVRVLALIVVTSIEPVEEDVKVRRECVGAGGWVIKNLPVKKLVKKVAENAQ